MKLIIAIIQPTKLDAVKEALTQVDVHRLIHARDVILHSKVFELLEGVK